MSEGRAPGPSRLPVYVPARGARSRQSAESSWVTAVREERNGYRVSVRPVIKLEPAQVEVGPDDEASAVEDAKLEEELRSHVLEAILGLVVEEARAPARRNHRRNSRRRRRRTRRASQPSMYEVVDVDYEAITGLKDPPRMDWRVSPRYELSPAEVARQERELFFLMTSEENAEAHGAPELGVPPCCVCHENGATRVVVPCGHRCLCQPCALRIATNRSLLEGNRLAKRCPICQAAISLILRLR